MLMKYAQINIAKFLSVAYKETICRSSLEKLGDAFQLKENGWLGFKDLGRFNKDLMAKQA